VTTHETTRGTAVEGAEFYIDGEFRRADKCEPVREAATGEVMGDGASATEADIDAAVAAARAALPQWRSASVAHRAEILRAFAAALYRRAGSTDKLVSRENGMPMSLSRGANGLFPAALLCRRLYRLLHQSRHNGASVLTREGAIEGILDLVGDAEVHRCHGKPLF
jgi:acyl-CoA reductase-like NAD-dependent aldehyde dehydrogenase